MHNEFARVYCAVLAVEFLSAVLVGLDALVVADGAATHQRTVGVVVVDLLQRTGIVDDGTHVTLIVLDVVVPLPASLVAVVVVDALQHTVAVHMVAAVVELRLVVKH